ncbi:hypothetical protein [Aequorivita echinoideorum]|uniref:Lipocalin-like domain-containing protein n=1 Tax=Aequorivita echinoideorum TaxID=1549647 RepID=A0ABS5S594_9FLAO|nr:hypothetical protein [Aequorivita echinoideorum]MBT0608386.1 hypothetical protein [Aequorivita echinoideorum]
MKKLLLILSLAVMFSCSSDDDSGDVINDEFDTIVNILPQGQWRVSYFANDGGDQTSSFESFVFNFNADGTVTAVNDLFSEEGTWRYESSANNSDDDNDEELVLQFTQTTPFSEISEDYDIVSISTTTIELSDDKDSTSASTELLTFTKI